VCVEEDYQEIFRKKHSGVGIIALNFFFRRPAALEILVIDETKRIAGLLK